MLVAQGGNFLNSGSSLWLQLLLQVVLITINAIFACAEIAIISMNDNKLAKLAGEGNKKAIKLTKLTSQPSSFLSTIQVGITLAGFLSSAFAAENFASRLVSWLIGLGVTISPDTLTNISVIVITLILSYFTLVFGELVPKRIGMKNAEKIALSMSGFIYGVSKVFAPLVSFLTFSTNTVLKMFRIDPNDEESDVSEEEIRMMIDQGSEKGSIDIDEKYMLQNVFEFDDKTAKDVMTHRTDVSLLWLEESMEQWSETIKESRHTHYPVCNETTDNVVGVLNTKDYFRIDEKTRDNVMKCVKPAYFIPESVRTDILLTNMQRTRNHFAIVLDEYGGMEGIVTVTDLLEQIVGNLDDEGTIDEPVMIERIDSKTWSINGAAPLDLVSTQVGVPLPDDYETFGGFVFSLLGFIPNDGSQMDIEEFGLVIKITEIKDHQLEKAIVCLVNPESETETDTKESK